jgi:periplasmic protein TonB
MNLKMNTRKNFVLVSSLLFLSSSAMAQPKVKAGFGVSVVQTQPEFPGGVDSLMSYLRTNLHYPPLAKKAWIEGKVFVGFLIDSLGKIRDARLLNSVNKDIDDEALRVVMQMPDWKAGTIAGGPTRVQYILPIDFVMPKKQVGIE